MTRSAWNKGSFRSGHSGLKEALREEKPPATCYWSSKQNSSSKRGQGHCSASEPSIHSFNTVSKCFHSAGAVLVGVASR